MQAQLSDTDKALVLQLKKQKVYAHVIEERLREWGAWLTKELDCGTGYPSKSITVTALEGARSTAIQYAPDNQRAEQVHAAYLNLQKRHYQYATVLSAHYVLRDFNDEKPMYKKLGLTLSTYKTFLKLAKIFIESKIT